MEAPQLEIVPDPSKKIVPTKAPEHQQLKMFYRTHLPQNQIPLLPNQTTAASPPRRCGAAIAGRRLTMGTEGGAWPRSGNGRPGAVSVLAHVCVCSGRLCGAVGLVLERAGRTDTEHSRD